MSKTELQLKADLALIRLRKLQGDVDYLDTMLRSASEGATTFESEDGTGRVWETVLASMNNVERDIARISLAIRA